MIAFEEVYSWLNIFSSSHIRPSSTILIRHMKTALEEGHAPEAAGLLQHLKDFAYKLRDDAEVLEVLLECAETASRMGNLEEAGGILVDAVSRAWPDPHRRAVVQWLLGTVQWRSMPARQQAAISWRNSIFDFERLAKQPSLSRQQRLWYEGTCRRLEQSLAEALEEVGRYMDLLQSTGTAEDKFAAHSEQVSAPLLSSNSAVTHISEPLVLPDVAVDQTTDILQLFTISEVIPAGGFGPTGVDPSPKGKLEINNVLIDGIPHRIVNLREGRLISINLASEQRFMVLRVIGDSMNEEGIDEGDYVMLRQSGSPNSGDIVAAEIVGIDNAQATLKKYFVTKLDTQGNRLEIILEPHSRNPKHEPRTFSGQKGFFIRGIALAVFKKI